MVYLEYLEEMDPKQSAEDNIATLCFKKGGILLNEFEHIFSDMFQRRTSLYRDIINSLVHAPKENNRNKPSM